MTIRRSFLFLSLLAAAACGDDGGSGDDTPSPDAADQPDSEPQPDAAPSACGELTTPAGTIAAYPGTFDGTVTGAGADLNVAEGVCDVEGDAASPTWYDQIGEDAVVHLTGLTVGTMYAVDLQTEDDLGFYVITGCDEAAGGPGTGMCPLFDDRTTRGEINVFTAGATEAWVVVDNGEFDGPPASGAFTVNVSVAECLDSFDCTSADAPVCAAFVCAAGPTTCTGDDAGDATTGGDDGPAGARALTPAAGTPDSETAAICNAPGAEADYYAVTVTAGQPLTINVTWEGAADLDVLVVDAENLAYGVTYWTQPEQVDLSYLPAGTYYVIVTLYSSTAVTAAVPYTITASTAAAQTCATVADCAAEYSTQIFRGECNADGACHFLPSGAGASGTICDSGDDCESGLCSYILFEADAQDSVCTVACTDQTGCAGVTGTTCLVAAEMCVPSCATDLECGANINSGTIDAGEPWNYLTCAVDTGVCSL